MSVDKITTYGCPRVKDKRCLDNNFLNIMGECSKRTDFESCKSYGFSNKWYAELPKTNN